MVLRKKEEPVRRCERRSGKGRAPGRDGLLFLMTFLGALLLGLPGTWCFLAAALTAGSFLLFLRSTRDGCPPASARRARPQPLAPACPAPAACPRRDAC